MHIFHFSDSLPRHPEPVQKRQAHRKNALLQGKRIVVVEDEGITQMQLHRILQYEGMDVVDAAMSGPTGVEAVLRTRPDIVLMDIHMSGEYDGLEAARRILETSNVCIIMLTAFSDESYREQANRIGVCGYVVKPVDQLTLLPQMEAAWRAFQPH